MSARVKYRLSILVTLPLLAVLALATGAWTSEDEDFTGPLPDDISLFVRPEHVYILNLDGVRADYINATNTPFLYQLTTRTARRTGWKYYPTGASGVLPSVTSTNHTAILTSTSAGKSGILGAVATYEGLSTDFRYYNQATFRTYTAADVNAVSLFEIVKQHKPSAKTAIVAGKSWLVDLFDSVDIAITGKTTASQYSWIPRRDGYVLGGPPSSNVTSNYWWCVSEAQGGKASADCNKVNVRNVPATPTSETLTAENFPSSRWIMETALEVVRHEDPFLLYVVFQSPDTAGHFYGAGKEGSTFFADSGVAQFFLKPNKAAILNEVKNVDRLVAAFIQSLDALGKLERSVLVITADHGMTTSLKATGSDPGMLDLRSELEGQGWRMKAIDPGSGTRILMPNPAYEWLGSEGPVAYIYGITSSKDSIKTWIESKPQVLRVVDTATDTVYGLKDQRPRRSSNAPWPHLIVFFKEGYYCPIYSDQFRGGANAVGLTIKMYGVLGVSPGLHGSESTQSVPLFLRVPGFTWWKGRPPRTIDIVPTLLHRLGWSRDGLGLDGSSLIYFYF